MLPLNSYDHLENLVQFDNIILIYHCKPYLYFFVLCNAGSGTKNDFGYQEDFITVERPGAGWDKHRSPPQFPGAVIPSQNTVVFILPQDPNQPWLHW